MPKRWRGSPSVALLPRRPASRYDAIIRWQDRQLQLQAVAVIIADLPGPKARRRSPAHDIGPARRQAQAPPFRRSKDDGRGHRYKPGLIRRSRTTSRDRSSVAVRHHPASTGVQAAACCRGHGRPGPTYLRGLAAFEVRLEQARRRPAGTDARSSPAKAWYPGRRGRQRLAPPSSSGSPK